jgi:hypothetical protein
MDSGHKDFYGLWPQRRISRKRLLLLANPANFKTDEKLGQSLSKKNASSEPPNFLEMCAYNLYPGSIPAIVSYNASAEKMTAPRVASCVVKT